MPLTISNERDSKRDGLIMIPGPDFVIVGAQKAASTSVMAGLREHPEIWLGQEEDPFLRDPLFDPSQIDLFLQRYSGATGQLCGLKCPDYLGQPEVPERLAALPKKPRIIIILRDPVKRAISAYYWYLRWNVLPLEHPDLGLQKLLAGAYSHVQTADQILTWGLYGEHVERYLTYFERPDLFITTDHELRSDFDATLQKAFGFLGVDTNFEPSGGAAMSNLGIYSPLRLRVARLRGRLILVWDESSHTYWNIYRPNGRVRSVLNRGLAGVDRFVLSRFFSNEPPKISRQTRAALWAYYRGDTIRLARSVGIDISPWLRANSSGVYEG